MNTTIAGIPCVINLISPGFTTPAYSRGHPDNWEPESGDGMEWEVCDRRGRLAPWLACKLSAADVTRIETELLEHFE